MAWLELTFRTRRGDWARIESALEEVGALSVTLLDAEDAPILEPGPGETPLWPELVANALFDEGTDRRGLVATIHELAPAFDPDRATFREVEDADWTRAWMDQFRPMRFGRRLWIYPSNVEPPADDHAVVVRLDPGLAFGTGTHATTALCLEWLDALFDARAHESARDEAHTDRITVGGAGAPPPAPTQRSAAPSGLPPLPHDLVRRASVLDYGCGSGVLAIAAVKLGAASATGVDNDPQALIATNDNAQRNGVADRIVGLEPGDPALAPASYDVVVANILAGALVALAPTIAALAKPGAPVALSGILPEQADEVIAAWEPWCEGLAASGRDGWIRVDGRRRR